MNHRTECQSMGKHRLPGSLKGCSNEVGHSCDVRESFHSQLRDRIYDGTFALVSIFFCCTSIHSLPLSAGAARSPSCSSCSPPLRPHFHRHCDRAGGQALEAELLFEGFCPDLNGDLSPRSSFGRRWKRIKQNASGSVKQSKVTQDAFFQRVKK